jgi:hypothetical protein
VITVKPVSAPLSTTNDITRWTVRAERKIVQQINVAQVAQMIQGFGSRNAQIQLEKNFPLASSPEINLSPSWWPWVPIVPFRISIVTE